MHGDELINMYMVLFKLYYLMHASPLLYLVPPPPFCISLCYNEYRKRRSGPQKNSDRVGLLRSRAEEEEIVSDQESEMVPKKSQVSIFSDMSGVS